MLRVLPHRRRLLLAVAAVLACVARPAAHGSSLCDTRPPWLADGDAPVVEPLTSLSSAAGELRVVTYNVHSGLGRRHAFHRARAVVEQHLRSIAAAIASAAPAVTPVDVVGLNEIDFGSRRSGGFDHATFLADELGRLTGVPYAVVRGETWHRTLPGFGVRFGNAVLTRHPVVHATACLLDGTVTCAPADPDGPAPLAAPAGGLPALRSPGWLDRLLHEARGVVQLTIAVPPPFGDGGTARPVDVLVTHLDAFVQAEREAQAAWLVSRFVRPDRATVLLGDMNAVPTVLTTGRRFFGGDRTHDVLTSGLLADARVLHAAARGVGDLGGWATFPADRPVWPLDVALATLDLLPAEIATIGDAEASDHRGLFVRYAVASDGEQTAARSRHAAIRRRQAARISACDLAGAARAPARRWLLDATGFAAFLTTTQGG